MIEIGDLITLENDIEYVVASTCIDEGKHYAYVVNTNDAMDCILGEVKNDDFITVTDTSLFAKLMPMLLDNVDDSILNDTNEEDTDENNEGVIKWES